MTIDELHRQLEAVSDRRLGGRPPVYELSGGWLPFTRRARSLGRRQERVLTALRSLGWPAFVCVDDDPSTWELPGAWLRAARGTWALPREVEDDRLLRTLLLAGNWKLYLASAAVDPARLPDLFRGALPDAVASIETLGIPALIDALHDNSAWRALLQPAAGSLRAAA